MIQTILANMVAFAKSMPTNMLIIVLICLVMKFALKKSAKDCIRVVIGYLLIGVLLGIFGITMPDFLTIGTWIANIIKSIGL